MSTWNDMNAEQRSHTVGELMGVEKLSQCFLAVGGQRVLATPHAGRERGRVEAMLLALRASDDLWAEFRAGHSEATDDWRTQLEVEVVEWHLRYADTPGGGWEVLEYLRREGWEISVNGAPDAVHWFVSAGRGRVSQGGAECHRTDAEHMAEAACRLLVTIKAPELLAEVAS